MKRLAVPKGLNRREAGLMTPFVKRGKKCGLIGCPCKGVSNKKENKQ